MKLEERNGFSTYFRDIEEARQNWSWFLAFGLLLMALGIGIMSFSYYATVFSVILFGFFLMGAGIVQIIQAFLARKWSGLFLSLVLGILYLIAGFLCATKPAMAAVTLTLWIAALCFIIGISRMLISLLIRFDHWGWVFFNGLITFLLGAMIYSDWPVSGLWVIGLFIGVDMFLSGWSWVILSLSARARLNRNP